MDEFLKEVIGEILELQEDVVENLTNETDLIELGLDSLKAIELVVHIEDNYDIMISDDDLLLDNISTIAKIETLVQGYLDE